MIDKLDLFFVKELIETQTINTQTFLPANTQLMPGMFKCSNAAYIITGTASNVLRLKVWGIAGAVYTYKGSLIIDGEISMLDLTDGLAALLV